MQMHAECVNYWGGHGQIVHIPDRCGGSVQLACQLMKRGATRAGATASPPRCTSRCGRPRQAPPAQRAAQAADRGCHHTPERASLAVFLVCRPNNRSGQKNVSSVRKCQATRYGSPACTRVSRASCSAPPASSRACSPGPSRTTTRPVRGRTTPICSTARGRA